MATPLRRGLPTAYFQTMPFYPNYKWVGHQRPWARPDAAKLCWGASPKGAGSWQDLERGSPASPVSEAWSATGSIRRWPSSLRRRTPAGVSRGRSCSAMTARVSAAVFVPAVESSIMATGHDVLVAGPTATPTIGWLVRRHGCGRGHPDLGFTQSAQVQRTEVLPAGRDGVEPIAGPADARSLARPRVSLGELGRAGTQPFD